LLAVLALLPAAGVQAGGILVFGDSISVGSDDEPVPGDGCAAVPAPLGGWSALLECRLRARGDTRTWTRYAQGGTTSWWGVVNLERAIAAAPGATTALLSFHVNDCALACGAVCAAGERAGLACARDGDCPSSRCDYSAAHPCSSAETRDNLRTIIDGLLGDGYERVIYWKSPGRIGGLESGNSCGLEQFDGSPDAVDTLFLADARPVGYADELRVEYVDETFLGFCPGSGLQGCGPGDGQGDRRRWWFAHDGVDGSGGNVRHIHPNAWGYMELAARLGGRLVGQPMNRRPPRPSVLLTGIGHASLSIAATPGVDPDGDPVAVYAWATCVDTRGTSADPACDRPSSPLDAGPFLARECGAFAGADHDGLGFSQANLPWPVRHVALVVGGAAVLDGLAPETDYRVCAVAWDGFQGSWLDEAIVARTLAPPDSDGDTVPDPRDTCLEEPDPGQLDSDRDGYGNACDADYDGDGAVGASDYLRLGGSLEAGFGQAGLAPELDAEGDGVIGFRELELLRRELGGPPGPSGLACAGSPPCP
jgi:hypothetical protein